MLSRSSELFLLADLKELDKANSSWFSEYSRKARVARCLLDTVEYLRADLKLPGRFRQVSDAHTMRLVCRCLSDPHLDRTELLKRLKPLIIDSCAQIRVSRKDDEPLYGDDFWDWAAVIDAFLEVTAHFTEAIPTDELRSECESFRERVTAHLDTGLTVNDPEKEWYGPATAALAHRVLARCRDRFAFDVDETLSTVRDQALTLVTEGSYRGRAIPPHLILWHYGQVVVEFGASAAKQQYSALSDYSSLNGLEKWDQVYVIARILQAAHKAKDDVARDKALNCLNRCESQTRPLGYGLMGENVKGSLNILEALWPTLDPGDKAEIRKPLDALLSVHRLANTVGILVAIETEARAVEEEFRAAGAPPKQQDGVTVFEHDRYRAVMCAGKAIPDATDATRTLLDRYKAKWVIMVGVAGSLGTFDEQGKHLNGPDMGHVVVATSLAPFRIYQKVRQTIENARVPLRGDTWSTIPAHPVLFRLAHEAGDALLGKSFHEGLIVTGTGVQDALDAKQDVLTEFPGGLAVEVEGYIVGLLCMVSGTPYVVIRGISDRAQGDKEKQSKSPDQKTRDQLAAASAAAKVAVRVVDLMSQQW